MSTKTPWNFDGPLPDPEERFAVTCIGCGNELDAHTMLEGRKSDGPPQTTDVMVCAACSAVMIYEAELPGHARHVTASEMDDIEVLQAYRIARQVLEDGHLSLQEQEWGIVCKGIEMLMNMMQNARRKAGLPPLDFDVATILKDHTDGSVYYHATKPRSVLLPVLREWCDKALKEEAEAKP